MTCLTFLVDNRHEIEDIFEALWIGLAGTRNNIGVNTKDRKGKQLK